MNTYTQDELIKAIEEAGNLDMDNLSDDFRSTIENLIESAKDYIIESPMYSVEDAAEILTDIDIRIIEKLQLNALCPSVELANDFIELRAGQTRGGWDIIKNHWGKSRSKAAHDYLLNFYFSEEV